MPETASNPNMRFLKSGLTAVTVIAAVTAVTGAAWLHGGPIKSTPAASALSLSAPTSDVADTGAVSDTEVIQNQLQQLVDAGYPSVSAAVTTPDGSSTAVAVGEGNLATGEPAPVDGQVRIGSNTKMFVSTVVMQLVEEGAVTLDESAGSYLPGLVMGEGIDGEAITVRQLLQHTAGLPEYADAVAADAFGVQHTHISPRDMLDIALEKRAVFAPGEKWEYSNTNYLVLGLLIESVTERPLYEEIDRRIVEPLQLKNTYMPVPGEQDLRGDHPIGYHVTESGDLKEITVMDPSFAWAAGSMVSTPSELNTFMQALLNGDLLSQASVAEMQQSVPAGDELWPEATYGLGLQSHPVPDGGIAWGHGGDIPGTQTRNAVGPDGTAVTIAVTALPWAIGDATDEDKLLGRYRIVLNVLDEILRTAQ